MGDKLRMQLENPFLIGLYSLALLSIGAAIGARWGHSPHVALWMVVLGAGLIVAHDVLTYSIVVSFVSTAWGRRTSWKREMSVANPQDPVANAGLPRTKRSADSASTARDTLLDRLRDQSAINAGLWTREELYEARQEAEGKRPSRRNKNKRDGA